MKKESLPMQRLLTRLTPSFATLAAIVLSLATAHSRAQCVSHWEPVGIPDPVAFVNAMITFDSGAGPGLYIAGEFGTAAGTTAINIARLSNGVAQSLGDGLSGAVHALALFDNGQGIKLYAGGEFQRSGSIQLLNLAAWDGITWSPVGGGTNGTVYALATHNDGSGSALFVGGEFTRAGSTSVSNIARWNGSTWNHLAGSPLPTSLYRV